MPVLSLYRNQSIDLGSKSNDWFLYEGNTGIVWVKQVKTNNCFNKSAFEKFEKKEIPKNVQKNV